MKKKILFIAVILYLAYIITGCAASEEISNLHDINELDNYEIELKKVTNEEIDKRCLPINFTDTELYSISEEPEEPEIIDMTNYIPEPITLYEVCNSPAPPYTLFYFVDNTGEIQLRAYGEVFKYRYLEDNNGNLIIEKADTPEEFGKGMYAITPVKRILNGKTIIDFAFSYDSPIENVKPINIEDEPF